MQMELVKKAGDHQIFKKRSGRYAVKDANGAYVRGEDKIKVLSKEGLLKPPAKKKAAEGEAKAEG
jgi:hypothetical protein